MIWKLCAACANWHFMNIPVTGARDGSGSLSEAQQTSGNRFSNSPGLCRGVFFVLFCFFQKLYGFLWEEICASEYYLLAQNCKERSVFLCAQSTIGVDHVHPCPTNYTNSRGELRSLCCLASFNISIIHPLVLCPEPNTKWPVLFG